MPTYDFRCPDGHEFEKFFRSIGAAVAELPCPTCGLVAQRRVSGGAGLLFRGSGFYLTDYGRDAHRKPAPGAANGGKPGVDAGRAGGEGGGGGDKAAAEKPAADAKPAGDTTKSAGGAPAAGGSSPSGKTGKSGAG